MHIKGNAIYQGLMIYVKAIIKSSVAIICVISLVISNAAYSNYSALQLEMLIKHTIPKNELRINATSEVVVAINHILHHHSAQEDIRNALKRMSKVKSIIVVELQNKNLPLDLLVLPIVESEYKQSLHERGTSQPAGIWQMVPQTARKYGLVIKGKRDDRLDIQAETVAISKYLNDLYAEFRDWRLVLIAYKLGEFKTIHLINRVGSRDPWVIAHSKHAPSALKHYLSKIDSIVIIMHNPSLIGLK